MSGEFFWVGLIATASFFLLLLVLYCFLSNKLMSACHGNYYRGGRASSISISNMSYRGRSTSRGFPNPGMISVSGQLSWQYFLPGQATMEPTFIQDYLDSPPTYEVATSSQAMAASLPPSYEVAVAMQREPSAQLANS